MAGGGATSLASKARQGIEGEGAGGDTRVQLRNHHNSQEGEWKRKGQKGRTKRFGIGNVRKANAKTHFAKCSPFLSLTFSQSPQNSSFLPRSKVSPRMKPKDDRDGGEGEGENQKEKMGKATTTVVACPLCEQDRSLLGNRYVWSLRYIYGKT